jgi:hypothetical protein
MEDSMGDNVFLDLEEALRAERPINVGFQHTEYAKRLFGIAFRFKDRLYREDADRFHTALFMEANAYRESFMHLINNNTWEEQMKELKGLLDPNRFPSKHKGPLRS